MAGSNWDFPDYVNPASQQPRQPTSPSGAPPDVPWAATPETAPTGWGGFPAQPVDYAFPSGATPLTTPFRAGKPPVWVLAACLVVGLAAGALAWLWGETPLWALVAWGASGPLAIGLLAVFNVLDTRARAMAAYSRPGWVTPAYVACIVVGFAAICLSAARIAFWVGRL